MVKREIIHFPQTYGPFRSVVARWIARWILRRSSTIIARDRESQHIAQGLVGSDKEVLLSPDVAFALQADIIKMVELDGQEPAPLPENSIGLNVNGLLFNGGYTGKNMFGLNLDYRRFVTELASALLALHSGPLLLVPHTYAPAGNIESDNDACHHLKESLPLELRSRVKVVTGEYDAHKLKGIIGQCRFFVGSRMHSCIAALSQGVPCVGVAYSMKFRGVFESVGVADWVVDGRSVNSAQAVSDVLRLYGQADSIKEDLGRAAQSARKELIERFAVVLQTPRCTSTETAHC
jgi:polysaccharide pyruvyl transferase WcaK-like protein